MYHLVFDHLATPIPHQSFLAAPHFSPVNKPKQVHLIHVLSGTKKLHSGRLAKPFEVLIKKVLVHLLVKSCQSVLSQKSSKYGLLRGTSFGIQYLNKQTIVAS